MNRILVKMVFGSHLYGTATENSDLDYKGVFVPTARDILLGRVPKSIRSDTGDPHTKNKPGDVDCEMHSLQHFIKLALEGQTVALDMLHAPLDGLEAVTPEWEFLHENRAKFYTKSLSAFIGYAQRQAAKYGIKGSRLAVMQEFLSICANHPEPGAPMMEIWGKLPVTEHSKFIEKSPDDVLQYSLCGRTLQATGSIRYTADIIQKVYDSAGDRAKQAERNEGVEWKAVSHALRAAFQMKEVLISRNITFPRPEADFLLKVKTGNLLYKEEVAPVLESLVQEVKELSEVSHLPEKPDVEFWEDFLFRVYRGRVLGDVCWPEPVQTMKLRDVCQRLKTSVNLRQTTTGKPTQTELNLRKTTVDCRNK